MLRIKHGWENRVWEELILSYLADDHEFLNAVCGMVPLQTKSDSQLKEELPADFHLGEGHFKVTANIR